MRTGNAMLTIGGILVTLIMFAGIANAIDGDVSHPTVLISIVAAPWFLGLVLGYAMGRQDGEKATYMQEQTHENPHP